MKWLFLHLLRMFAKIFRVFFSLLSGAFLILVPILLVIYFGFHFGGDEGAETIKSCVVSGAVSILMGGIFRGIERWADTKIKTEFPDETTGRRRFAGVVSVLLFLGAVGWFSSGSRTVRPTASSADDFEETEDISTPEETPEEEPLFQSDGFVFPNSDTELIDRKEIENLSDLDLTHAINELYARHGYIFQNQQMREYYEQFDWYHGEVPADEFSTSCFNQMESDNWNLLVGERDKRRKSDG